MAPSQGIQSRRRSWSRHTELDIKRLQGRKCQRDPPLTSVIGAWWWWWWQIHNLRPPLPRLRPRSGAHFRCLLFLILRTTYEQAGEGQDVPLTLNLVSFPPCCSELRPLLTWAVCTRPSGFSIPSTQAKARQKALTAFLKFNCQDIEAICFIESAHEGHTPEKAHEGHTPSFSLPSSPIHPFPLSLLSSLLLIFPESLIGSKPSHCTAPLPEPAFKLLVLTHRPRKQTYGYQRGGGGIN